MMYSLLSTLPIILILLLVFAFKRPLFQVAPLVYLAVLALAGLVWRMDLAFIGASTLRGGLIALDIALIIFGAIFFLEYFKRTGSIQRIQDNLMQLSPDLTIQVFLIAWLFGSFIEGVAGFGTPAAIVAPFLVTLGFGAPLAASVALIANTTAVSFGAVGTPIRVGFAGLNVEGVAFNASLIHAVVGSLIPLLILWVLKRSPEFKSEAPFKVYIPIALIAGFSFTLPALAFSYFISFEFISIFGAITGLLIMGTLVTKRLFLPKTNEESAKKTADLPSPLNFMRSFAPYLVLTLLLVIGRFVFGPMTFTVSLLGVLPHEIGAFNPGWAFLANIFLFGFFTQAKKEHFSSAAQAAFSKLIKAFVTILFISAFVQIMIHSDENPKSLMSMLNYLADLFQTEYYAFIAPLMGTLGSFMAGSATVSNLIFGPIASTIAQDFNLRLSWILGLQLVGAAIGNMIALQNIVAVQATVQAEGKEREIFKTVFFPCVVYLSLAGIIGLALSLIW
jgi:lactate permease